MSLLRRSNQCVQWLHGCLELALEQERAQLPLWAPVALGAGICAWFALPAAGDWVAWTMACAALALLGGALARGSRLGQAVAIGAALMAAGCLLPWGKALLFGAPPLARPAMAQFEARVLGRESLAARDSIRLTLVPLGRPDLPVRLRVNAPSEAVPAGIGRGDRVALRARLMPPPAAMLPGSYDYAMRAYFEGIGGTGRVIGPVRLLSGAGAGPGMREGLVAHVRTRLPGAEGAIAATLATGDTTGISEEDAEAMRRSGLAHLLSISGLHVSAVIGAVILIVYRLLALSPALALRFPLILIASIAGAGAGIGYTLLTGAQVPTVRSCVAALLVILGLALGREAISLRLIATGALIVMAFWPESVVGPSFQMSFAAVTALVALYEWPPARDFFARHEEGRLRRIGRGVLALLVSGALIELVLMPIALYHFHRAGLLGALANLVAIPLTSFVIMPAEALALLLDLFGLGAPAWWVTGWALRLLLGLAHHVAALPIATFATPAVGGLAFAVTMLALLWLMLWRGRVRWLGLPVAVTGFMALIMTPPPDLLVSADGRHVAVRTATGYALLRDRAGDYARETLSEAAGYEGDLAALATLPQSRCSSDLCAVGIGSSPGAHANLLATRSSYLVPYRDLVAACAAADIVVSDRRLPPGCTPRWLKLDRANLPAMGGAFIRVDGHDLIAGRSPRDRHPWVARRRSRQW